MLLGTRDWQRRDWVEGYFPADLPRDWRLAYYANDADCVMLPAATWLDTSVDMDEQLDEAPEHLAFFLEAPQHPMDYDIFERRFRDRSAVVLAANLPVPEGIPNWAADPAGGWRAPDNGALLQCLELTEFDLRALRRDIESLSPEVAVLVLEGVAASPARLSEVRTLIELMGRA